MSDSPLIGRVKGLAADRHRFTIVAFDQHADLDSGEFVVCPIAGQPVLARLVERRPLRPYPDSFLTTAALEPHQVATAVGYAAHTPPPVELVAELIGAFDPKLQDFINPRRLPEVGAPVRLAGDVQLSHLLNRRQPGQPGAAHLGWLLSRAPGAVPVALDVAALTSTHLAIIASTGAGKSYLAGVLVEELLGPHNRAALLIIDPHGEYGSLAALGQQTHRPQVVIHKPGTFKIQTGSLSLADLRYLLPDLSDRMKYVLGEAFRQCRRGAGWTLADLRQAIAKMAETDSGKKGKYSDTANALLWRLGAVFADTQLFDDYAPLRLADLVRPGQATILQLNEIQRRQQQVLVAALLRQLYRARLQTSKGTVTERSLHYLPYPLFVLIEEAHHFAPAGETVVSGGILKQILGEGRKFGLGVGLISQRPGKLAGDVLSQCNTTCLLRIINPVDQQKVRESVEAVGQDLLRELPALSKGQAIIAGAAVNTPILCQVRPRQTPHLAQDIAAPQVWREYFGRKK